jgi:hypothetical protein
MADQASEAPASPVAPVDTTTEDNILEPAEEHFQEAPAAVSMEANDAAMEVQATTESGNVQALTPAAVQSAESARVDTQDACPKPALEAPAPAEKSAAVSANKDDEYSDGYSDEDSDVEEEIKVAVKKNNRFKALNQGVVGFLGGRPKREIIAVDDKEEGDKEEDHRGQPNVQIQQITDDMSETEKILALAGAKADMPKHVSLNRAPPKDWEYIGMCKPGWNTDYHNALRVALSEAWNDAEDERHAAQLEREFNRFKLADSKDNQAKKLYRRAFALRIVADGVGAALYGNNLEMRGTDGVEIDLQLNDVRNKGKGDASKLTSARFLRKKVKVKQNNKQVYLDHRNRHMQVRKELFEMKIVDIEHSILVGAMITATFNTGRERTEMACKRESQLLKRQKQVQEDKLAAEEYAMIHEKDFNKEDKLAGVKKEDTEESKWT